MSQDYGQGQGYPTQGTPPGGTPYPGGYQQQPAYQAGYQQPGYSQQGYPQQGLPQAPSYQGFAAAPPEYGGQVGRPSATTAASVLAFVQAGITGITTLLFIIGAAQANNGDGAAVGWLIVLAQAAGVVLLIVGGIQLMQAKSRVMLILACALELLISAFYIVVFAAIPSFNIDAFESIKAGMIVAALFFAIMPAISLFLAMGRGSSEFLARAGRR